MDDLLQEFRGYVEKFDKLQMRNSKENERGGVESKTELSNLGMSEKDFYHD